MSAAEILLVLVAGFGAGVVNAVAGGGTMLVFPALLVTGHSAVTANVTSTLAVLPGYLSGVAGFRDEVRDDGPVLRALMPVAVVGTLAGAGLLVVISEAAFDAVVPWLVLAATVLFAAGPQIQRRIAARRGEGEQSADSAPVGLLVAVGAASVYGGFFGAGLGIILLAALTAVLAAPMARLSGMKSVLQSVVGIVAAVLFAVAGPVAWDAAAVAAAGAVAGGYAGARLTRRLDARVVRATVVVIGAVVFVGLLARTV
ncbi:MAG: sulfite exporter TauE/SafE family protein [Solirubrobacteraceae bacterium]|nr:sulfite exporter TauE/SafE family protein [Solirubrobacteraceae bacterium]